MKFHLATPRTLALLGATSLVFVAGCSTTQHDTSPSSSKASMQEGGGDMKLPPGWTEQEMKACMELCQPGEMHAFMAKHTGTWTGTNTMWMWPGASPTESPLTATITKEMDGRYTKAEYKGDIPGMGPFHGVGYTGFDNVSQKFVASWLDNHSTGIMNGEGTLSADKKTLNWTYEYNCPMTKGPAKMRQIERYTSDDSMTIEMHGKDPKSGQDFKMMQIELKRTGKPGA